MNAFFTPQSIFDVAVLLFAAIGAIAYWSNGKNSRTNDDSVNALTTIQIKDEAIKALEKKQVEDSLRLNAQDLRITFLEAENKRLNLILENRNPELVNFMKQMTASMLEIERGMQELLKSKGSVTINN